MFWLADLSLGVLILAPQLMAGLLQVQGLTPQSTNYIRLIGLLVSALGTLYVISGRLNSQGFSFASMLDRPLVPLIMAVLWWKHILPGGMALAFSASDFSGFLWTLKAWRAEERPPHSLNPSLREMFRRMLMRRARPVPRARWNTLAGFAWFWEQSFFWLPPSWHGC